MPFLRFNHSQTANKRVELARPPLPAAVVRRRIGRLLRREGRRRSKAGVCLLGGGAGAEIGGEIAHAYCFHDCYSLHHLALCCFNIEMLSRPHIDVSQGCHSDERPFTKGTRAISVCWTKF
jgi:hypothetical protein